MKICYVAHRYYPFPGGTEYYVKNLAEETMAQGHDVTVLAAQNRGNQNGVKVTNDLNVLIRDQFDLMWTWERDKRVAERLSSQGVQWHEYPSNGVVRRWCPPSSRPACHRGRLP